MLVDGNKLVEILEGLRTVAELRQEQLKETVVYTRIIKLVKHMGKGVEPIQDNLDGDRFHCAICGNELRFLEKRCMNCGSLINWERYNGK